MLTTRLPSHCNLSVEQPPGRDSRRGTALLQLTSLLVNSTDSLNCVVRSCFHKVNRRQARQGELRSKRRSAGGEGALGYKVNRRQAREGALGYKVNRRQARQGELRSKRGSSGGEGPLEERVPWGTR